MRNRPSNIAKKTTFLTLFFTLCLLSSCEKGGQKKSSQTPEVGANKANAENLQELKKAKVFLPNGQTLNTTLAITSPEQAQGLSGVKPNDFGDYDAMLFVYRNDGYRGFWMPDTYFNLDIIFLDKNMRIVHIERDVPHHPGRQEPPRIARTPSIPCRHVLEIKASSPVSKAIKLGDVLQLKTKMPLEKVLAKFLPR